MTKIFEDIHQNWNKVDCCLLKKENISKKLEKEMFDDWKEKMNNIIERKFYFRYSYGKYINILS